MSWLNGLKNYLYYTRQERNGIAVLLVLAVLLFALPLLYPFLITKEAVNTQEFQLATNSFRASLSNLSAKQTAYNNSYKKNNFQSRGESAPTIDAEEFSFNPNTSSKEDLMRLGLSGKTAQSIINYRNKGGQFRKVEDFKKIYTLSEEDYNRLKSYVELPSAAATASYQKDDIEAAVTTPAETFAFDPNTTSLEDFVRLGLTEKTAKSILNYRNKGGQFRKVEDFKKIYTLPEEDYQRLAAYIEIAIVEQPKYTKNTPKTYQQASYEVLDVNAATAEQFQQFRGIGPSFSRRIVKFRELLGGFISTEQVGETYGLADSTFQKIIPYLKYNSANIQQLNINTATVEALKSHPYLSWTHAKAIVQHREENGLFKSVEYLQILSAFDDGKNTYQKVKPYLFVK